MDEFSLIKSIQQESYQQSTLIKGIGDDAAVFKQPNQAIVTAVDTFVDAVHFSKATMSPFNIGYRALAANLSDLAAMGAVPAFYLVSIIIPKDFCSEEIIAIFNGMKTLAKAYQMDLIGGDTVAGQTLALSITVIGYADEARVRYRSAARPDDVVFVTGTLGDSQAGLHILLHDGHYLDKQAYINSHQRPKPQIAFAQALREIERVSLNDISDGIANEAAEIADASELDLVLVDTKIPVSTHFNQFSPTDQKQWKYYGGEDFELVGTVPRKDFPKVVVAGEKSGVMVTEIGYTKQRETDISTVWLEEENQKQPLGKDGYIHLK